MSGAVTLPQNTGRDCREFLRGKGVFNQEYKIREVVCDGCEFCLQ
jgi:MinD superfamily P-loop ATPase